MYDHCVIRYCDEFLFGFSESLSPISQSEFDQEAFIVVVIIPASLPFCTEESVNFGFQASVQNFEFVEGQI